MSEADDGINEDYDRYVAATFLLEGQQECDCGATIVIDAQHHVEVHDNGGGEYLECPVCRTRHYAPDQGRFERGQ